jgi:hypothetical protein
MASTPSQRVVSNAGVLTEHLSQILNSLETPTGVVPFFSTVSVSSEELVRKLGLESTTYATFSQMATAAHLVAATALDREYERSTTSRIGMYSMAAQELQDEILSVSEESFLASRVIDQRTVSQRGNA